MTKKHILIINRYFYPDISSVPQLLTELTHDLARSGYKISVTCSRNSYNGKDHYAKFENHEGTDIHRVRNIYGRNRGMLFRLLEVLSFFIMIFFKALKIRNVDLIVILSSPPMLAFIGVVLGKLKKSKTLFLLEDVHPDLALALGYVKEKSFVFKMAAAVNGYVLRKVNKVVVIGLFMKEKVMSRFPVDPSKLVIIPNWADGKRIYPIDKNSTPFIKQWGLERKFVVQYSGNMGLGHAFHTMIDGMERLKKNNHIHFVFIGDGPRKKELVETVQKKDLQNVSFYPYQPYDKLLYSLNACDIALVSIREGMAGLLVPSKIYGILAAGKPFILVGGQNNEIAEISSRYGVGKVVAEGDADAFVLAVEDYYQQKEKMENQKKIARRVFESQFDRTISVAKYIETINTITGTSR